MYIRRALLRGVIEDRVYQPDYRLAVFVEIGLYAGVVDLAGFNFMQDAVDGELKAVVLLDARDNVRIARQHCFYVNIVAQQGANLIECDHVRGVGNGDDEFVLGTLQSDRQHMMATRNIFRYQCQRGGIRHRVGQVDGYLTETFR